MGVIYLIICALAAFLLFKDGSILFVPSLINAIASFWSFGVMHNYGPGNVRSNYERFVVALNMITLLFGVIFLIVAFAK